MWGSNFGSLQVITVFPVNEEEDEEEEGGTQGGREGKKRRKGKAQVPDHAQKDLEFSTGFYLYF